MVGSPGGVATCEEVTGLLVVLVEMMADKEMQVRLSDMCLSHGDGEWGLFVFIGSS